MNRKDLINTDMMISNRKKHFGLQGFHKKFSALRVNNKLLCRKYLHGEFIINP